MGAPVVFPHCSTALRRQTIHIGSEECPWQLVPPKVPRRARTSDRRMLPTLIARTSTNS